MCARAATSLRVRRDVAQSDIAMLTEGGVDNTEAIANMRARAQELIRFSSREATSGKRCRMRIDSVTEDDDGPHVRFMRCTTPEIQVPCILPCWTAPEVACWTGARACRPSTSTIILCCPEGELDVGHGGAVTFLKLVRGTPIADVGNKNLLIRHRMRDAVIGRVFRDVRTGDVYTPYDVRIEAGGR